MRRLLMLILPILLFASIGFSTQCYQETANVSTTCGGLDSGKYDFSTWVYGDKWVNSSALIDGNWTTNSQNKMGSPVYDAQFHVNYTTPNGITSAIWMVKSGSNYSNFTIPSSCFNGTTIRFHLVANGDPFGQISYACDNNNGSSSTLLIETNATQFYEEAMLWNFPTIQCQGWECPSIAKSLVGMSPIILGLAFLVVLVGLAMAKGYDMEGMVSLFAIALIALIFITILAGVLS